MLETGSSSGIKVEIPPITMVSPVSVIHEKEEEPEDIETDDPVFEGDFDEFFEKDDGEDNSSEPGEEESSKGKEE